MHEGEHCINAVEAEMTVKKSEIPAANAVTSIADIQRKDIVNLADAPEDTSRSDLQRVKGMLYESEVALYFLSEKFINCHRLGFVKRNTGETDNKQQHLIYIRNDNELTITPGVYEIPRSLKPGIYKVKAVKDDGLHIRDAIGRVKDYYENEECIDLTAGGILECTGEYELEWVASNKEEAEKKTRR